jgi:hypothetical protein
MSTKERIGLSHEYSAGGARVMVRAFETRGGRIMALCVIEGLAMFFAYLKVPLMDHIALATLPVLLAVLSSRR